VVFGPEAWPVVISAIDIPLGSGWELRTSGLWAEQTAENDPGHWSYGLEAFALAIEEPDELLRRGYGHRVPLGWELDFEAVDRPKPLDSGGDDEQDGSSQPGTIEGLLLTRDGERPLAGTALRSFWIGRPPAHSDLAGMANLVDSAPGSIVLPTAHGPWMVMGPVA